MTLYEILKVKVTASEREIKQSYRELAKTHHPDRLNGDAKRFRDIQRAYETLSNPLLRDEYDRKISRTTWPLISFLPPQRMTNNRAYVGKDDVAETLFVAAEHFDGADARTALVQLAKMFETLGD